MLLDLETIMKEWASDCEISPHQLDEVSRQTPNLHAKYLQHFANKNKHPAKNTKRKQKTIKSKHA